MSCETTYEEQNSRPDWFRMVPRLGYGVKHRSFWHLSKSTLCFTKKTKVAPDVLIVTLDLFLLFSSCVWFLHTRGSICSKISSMSKGSCEKPDQASTCDTNQAGYYFYIYIYIYIFVFVSIIFGRFVTKLGPGSVEIVFGIVFSSNLVGSNLDFIDSNTHSWPFLVPGICTKTAKMKSASQSTST